MKVYLGELFATFEVLGYSFKLEGQLREGVLGQVSHERVPEHVEHDFVGSVWVILHALSIVDNCLLKQLEMTI